MSLTSLKAANCKQTLQFESYMLDLRSLIASNHTTIIGKPLIHQINEFVYDIISLIDQDSMEIFTS